MGATEKLAGSHFLPQPSPARRLAPGALAAPASSKRSLCGWDFRGSGTVASTAPCKFKDVRLAGHAAAGSDSPEPGSWLLATFGCDHSAAPLTLNARSCVPWEEDVRRGGIFSRAFTPNCAR